MQTAIRRTDFREKNLTVRETTTLALMLSLIFVLSIVEAMLLKGVMPLLKNLFRSKTRKPYAMHRYPGYKAISSRRI